MTLNSQKYQRLHEILDKELNLQHSQIDISPIKQYSGQKQINYSSTQEQKFQKSEQSNNFITFSRQEANYMDQMSKLKQNYNNGNLNNSSPLSDKYYSEQNEKELNIIAQKVQNLEKQLEFYQNDQLKIQHKSLKKRKQREDSINSNNRITVKLSSLKKSNRNKSTNSLKNTSISQSKQTISYKEKYQKHKKLNIQLKQENQALQNSIQVLQKKVTKNQKLSVDYSKLQDNFRKSEQIRTQQKELILTMQKELEEMRDRVKFYKHKIKEYKKK